MAPKCLPPELLFEFVLFIPVEDALPNVFSSSWLLHNILHPRVIEWEKMVRGLINKSHDEQVAQQNARVAEQQEFIRNLQEENRSLKTLFRRVCAHSNTISSALLMFTEDHPEYTSFLQHPIHLVQPQQQNVPTLSQLQLLPTRHDNTSFSDSWPILGGASQSLTMRASEAFRKTTHPPPSLGLHLFGIQEEATMPGGTAAVENDAEVTQARKGKPSPKKHRPFRNVFKALGDGVSKLKFSTRKRTEKKQHGTDQRQPQLAPTFDASIAEHSTFQLATEGQLASTSQWATDKLDIGQHKELPKFGHGGGGGHRPF